MNLQQLLDRNQTLLGRCNTYDQNTVRSAQGFSRLLLVEEMCELTQQIIKIDVRGKTDCDDSYHEELADVVFLLDQAVRMADAAKLEAQLQFKMNRFQERYGDGRGL